MADALSALPALREYRTEKGLSQAALGKELGVTDVTVSRWETGRRKIDDELLPMVSEKTGIPKIKLRPDLARLLHQPHEAAE